MSNKNFMMRLLPLLLVLSAQNLSVWAQTSAPASRPKGLKELTEDLKRKVKGPVIDVSTADGKAFAEINRLWRIIPTDMRNTSVPQDKIRSSVDGVLKQGMSYVQKFQSGKNRASVLFYIGKLRSMNVARHLSTAMAGGNPGLEEMKRLRKEYMEVAYRWLDEAEALARKGKDQPLTLNVLKARGQAYYFGHEYERAAKHYRLVLIQMESMETSTDDFAEIFTALIGSLDKARKLRLAVNECKKFLQNPDNVRSRYSPHIVNLLGKLLLYTGRASEAVAHFGIYREMLQQAAAGTPITQIGSQTFSPPILFDAQVRKDFDSYLDRMDFQIGFAHYSLGQIDSARNSMASALAWLRTKSDNQTLSQVGSVFLNRADRVNNTLIELQGKLAPKLSEDIPSSAWLGEVLNLEQERGNVVALFFCPYKNSRSEEFMRALQAFYVANHHKGFRVAWLALPKGTKNMESQRERLREDTIRLGVGFPTTITVTQVWPPVLVETYNVAPGTPTLVLVDRRGNIAWYKMDPTFRDFDISRVVVDRLLKE